MQQVIGLLIEQALAAVFGRKALEERHLEKKNGDYEVAFFKDAEPDDVIRYVDSACGLLLDATTRLHSLLETGMDEKIKSLQSKLEAIRTLYSGDAPPQTQ